MYDTCVQLPPPLVDWKIGLSKQLGHSPSPWAVTVTTWAGLAGSTLIALYCAALGGVTLVQVPPENLATPVLCVTYRSPLEARAARLGSVGLPGSSAHVAPESVLR